MCPTHDCSTGVSRTLVQTKMQSHAAKEIVEQLADKSADESLYEGGPPSYTTCKGLEPSKKRCCRAARGLKRCLAKPGKGGKQRTCGRKARRAIKVCGTLPPTSQIQDGAEFQDGEATQEDDDDELDLEDDDDDDDSEDGGEHLADDVSKKQGNM